MRWFRNLIADLIFKYEWVWLEYVINYICELEMAIRKTPCSAVRKLSWEIEKIPRGMYCYDNNGMCPYFSISRVARFFYGSQCDGYCYYLNYGDFNSNSMILWDCCKCCGENFDDNYEGDEVECNLEL